MLHDDGLSEALERRRERHLAGEDRLHLRAGPRLQRDAVVRHLGAVARIEARAEGDRHAACHRPVEHAAEALDRRSRRRRRAAVEEGEQVGELLGLLGERAAARLQGAALALDAREERRLAPAHAVELGAAQLLLAHPPLEPAALRGELLALEAEPRPRVLEALHELAVAPRQVAELADGGEHLLLRLQREEQPQVAGAAEPVERGEPAAQVGAHHRQPPLEPGHLHLQRRHALRRHRPRRLRLGHPPFLQLELQPRPLELARQGALALLHAREARLQARDLAAQPLELGLAALLRRGWAGEPRQHRDRGDDQRGGAARSRAVLRVTAATGSCRRARARARRRRAPVPSASCRRCRAPGRPASGC